MEIWEIGILAIYAALATTMMIAAAEDVDAANIGESAVAMTMKNASIAAQLTAVIIAVVAVVVMIIAAVVVIAMEETTSYL